MREGSPISVEEGLEQVRSRIEAAAAGAGRAPGEVTLVAVSKGFDVDQLARAYDLGQRDFGENRVDELIRKSPELPEDVRWHLIGRLQTNKVRQMAAGGRHRAHLIHSVDRFELALEIDRRAGGCACLIQVNVAGESSKGGTRLEDAVDLWSKVRAGTGLRLEGLMAMAPFSADPELSRPHFAKLRQVRDRILEENPSSTIHHLSMGMSQDYVVAIQEGATIVRIGEAIFGPRPRTM